MSPQGGFRIKNKVYLLTPAGSDGGQNLVIKK